MKKSKNFVFSGVFPALVTPYLKDGTVDLAGQKKIVARHLEAGVAGVVVMGSNGENPYLTMGEKKKLIRSATAASGGRAPVIVGASEYGVEATLEIAAFAKKAGAAGLLVGNLTYFDVGLEGCLLRLRRIRSEVGLPVIWYNFPSVMNFQPSDRDMAEILKEPNVVGVKESIKATSTALGHMALAPKAKRIGFLAGNEYGFLPLLKGGGVGLIGGQTNAFPELFVEIYNEHAKGRLSHAESAQNKVFELAPIFYGEAASRDELKKRLRRMVRHGTPPGVGDGVPICITKEVMRLRGFPLQALVRDPLPQLKPYQKERVRRLLGEFGFI